MNTKEKLIVIEGTDGSGKKTQTDRLAEELRAQNYRVGTLSFPSYGEPSAHWVEKYLNGELGSSSDIDPYVASMFYALDRRAKKETIESLLHENDFVILDRYVDSNAAHQGSKIDDEKERMQYLEWLYQTEYVVFGIPKPNLTLILRVPAQTAQELVGKKQKREYLKSGTHDAHEDDIDHLTGAERTYVWLSHILPDDHTLVECTRDDALLSIDDIAAALLAELSKKRFI